MITAFLNQKGGVGKTTLSYSFATALAKAGHKVLLVDADPQHGAITWQSHREAAPLFPIVGLPTDKLHREMKSHTAHYDHLVIDAPPQVSGIARSIILATDLILIPVQPSPHDIWSAADMVRLIEEASTFKENLKQPLSLTAKSPIPLWAVMCLRPWNTTRSLSCQPPLASVWLLPKAPPSELRFWKPNRLERLPLKSCP